MYKSIFELLVLADLIAIGLILCRDDRKEFFNLFRMDIEGKDFLQLFFLCLLTFIGIWVSIPYSIIHLKRQKDDFNDTNI